MRGLQSAIKAKAPIVGIPVEGCEPVRVDRKRLASWAKDVVVQTARVEGGVDIWYSYEESARDNHEGPVNMLVDKVNYPRVLVLAGVAGRAQVSAKFVTVRRNDARLTLMKWADRERERLQKSKLLGALSVEQKRALKRSAMEDEGEGSVAVMVAGKLETDPKAERKGTPIFIPELPGINFATVRFSTTDTSGYLPVETVSFTITELSTGKACGSGKTAAEAFLDCRKKLSKLTPDKIAAIYLEVAQHQEAL